MHQPLSNIVLALAVATTLGLAASARAQTVAEDEDRLAIGLTALLDRLGAAAPTGAGVKVTQVEAPENASPGGEYIPNTGISELDGRTYRFFDDNNPVDPIISGHATSVARGFYGDFGIAPGVDEIDVYESSYWLTTGFLRRSTVSAPKTETSAVVNHSWIIGADSGMLTSTIENILRRIDLVAERDNVVFVMGVNNGSSSTFPDALSNAHNGIAVGLSNGNHSAGPTTVDPAGRVKPDLVAPSNASSWATGWTSGAATLLVETARGLGGDAADAEMAQTIKAVMLTGATKDEFAGWSRTTTQPLDLRYGAGELNIDHAHRILTVGQQEPDGVSTTVGSTGWDFDTIAADGQRLYFFETLRPIDSLTVTATWHRNVDRIGATLTPSLADMNLFLYEADGFTLGSMIDSSQSTIDNVEHMFQTDLGPGRYAVELTSDDDWAFALAWDAILGFFSGDFDGDGIVAQSDLDLVVDHWGQASVGELWISNLPDGIVGQAQLDAVLLNWGSGTTLVLGEPALEGLSAYGPNIPEPVSLLILGGGIVMAAVRRSGRSV